MLKRPQRYHWHLAIQVIDMAARALILFGGLAIIARLF